MPQKRLLDRVRDVIRLKHYSIRTEATYAEWALGSVPSRSSWQDVTDRCGRRYPPPAPAARRKRGGRRSLVRGPLLDIIEAGLGKFAKCQVSELYWRRL